jgi:hypothetical protein
MKESLIASSLIWFLSVSVAVAKIDTCTVRAYIISSPPGAEVYLGDRLMGRTPLSIDIDTVRDGLIILRHSGCKDYVISSGSIKEGLVMVNMKKNGDFDVAQGEKKETSIFGVPVQLISAVGVVSGAAAAYFKINADKMFSNYQSQAFNGHYDGQLLKRVNQYDRYSATSLVVMEVCVAALVYYLFRNE